MGARRRLISLGCYMALLTVSRLSRAQTVAPLTPGDDEAAVGVAVQTTREDLEHSLKPIDEPPGGAPSGYTMVEDAPRCYVTLGPRYCPAPGTGESFVDLYMSPVQRTSQVLVNAARMDPGGFRAAYMNGNSYACLTGTKPPFRYSPNLQQAAKQQAFFLRNSSCPFQHNTCKGYCYLYKDSCAWAMRVMAYVPTFSTLSENMAMTMATLANEPIAPVLQWLMSAAHCVNVFSSNSHLGTANMGRYWVQNFATFPDPNSNPLIDGSHWVDTRTSGKLRFLANYYTTTLGQPRTVGVVLNDTSWHAMALHLGNLSSGTYAFERPAPSTLQGCLTYYFEVTTVTGFIYTLPESGAFRTYGVAGCKANWASNRGPAPPTQAPTQAPTHRPTTAPSVTPTHSPTVSPTGAPTTRPTHVPTLPSTAQPTAAPTIRPTHLRTHSPTLSPSTHTSPPPPTQAPGVNVTAITEPGVNATAVTEGPTSVPTTNSTNSTHQMPTTNSTNSTHQRPTTNATNSTHQRPTTPPTTNSTHQRPTTPPTANSTQRPTPAPTQGSQWQLPYDQWTEAPTPAPTVGYTDHPYLRPYPSPAPTPAPIDTGAPQWPCFWPFCRL